MWNLADKYLVGDLKIECEQALTQLLKIENFLKIAKISDSVDSPLMKEAVYKFVASNTKALKEKGDLYNLPKHLLIQIFTNLGPK